MAPRTGNRMVTWLGGSAIAASMLWAGLLGGASAAFADANMTVGIDESASTVGVGETVTYTFPVRNQGTSGTANVVFTATIQNATFQPGSLSQPGVDRFEDGCVLQNNNTRVRCFGGFFDDGDQGSILVRATAPAQAGQIRVDASVTSGTDSDENPAGNSSIEFTTVIVRPDLRVYDIDGPSAVSDFVNDEYIVRVRNESGSTATGVRLRIRSESLPWDFTAVEVLDDASNFHCTLVRTLSFLTPEVECTGGALSVAESARIRISVRTTNVVGAGSGRIRAVIDPANTIRESNESNNSRNHTVSFNGGIF